MKKENTLLKDLILKVKVLPVKLCYAKEINATSEYAIYTAEKQAFQVLADPNLKRPLIPDFDLLAIFNPWEDFGRENIRPNPDISYEKRLRKLSIRERINLAETKQDFYARELPNLGNITQQTLKTINEMNDALDKGPYLQCIHHNDDAGSPASNPILNYPITVLLPQDFGIFSSSLLLIETPEQFVYFIECINPLGYRVEVNHLWEKAIQFAAKKPFNKKKVFFDLKRDKLSSADEMLTAIGLSVDKTKRVAMLTKNFGRRAPKICSHHATKSRPRFVLRPPRTGPFWAARSGYHHDLTA